MSTMAMQREYTSINTTYNVRYTVFMCMKSLPAITADLLDFVPFYMYAVC